MRSLTALFSFTVLVAGGVAAGSPAATAPSRTVYLNGDASLEKLQHANPDHYARAERILAAADELCRPGREGVYYARADARDVSCVGEVLRTSNPPKRQISFRLDDTLYIALVTVTGPAPRAVPAH